MSKRPESKLNELPLDKKVDLIRQHEHTRCSYSQLVKDFKIGKTTVGRIIRNKEQHLQQWTEFSSSNQRKRKIKKSSFYELNRCVKDWYDSCVTLRNFYPDGKLVQEKAKFFGDALGYDDFQASNGWL